jgi:hypothetical protein
MIVERANPIFNFYTEAVRNEYDPVDISISDFITFDSYRVASILTVTDPNDKKDYVSGPNEAFALHVNSAYESTDGEDAMQYYYNVALDGSGNDLNHELMKNATYQFYTYINEEPTSLSTYDVIAGDIIYPNVNRITYEEMEEIKNTQKRTISVINPANIARFAESYFTALNNG